LPAPHLPGPEPGQATICTAAPDVLAWKAVSPVNELDCLGHSQVSTAVLSAVLTRRPELDHRLGAGLDLTSSPVGS
jgi:hypothetical protein